MTHATSSRVNFKDCILNEINQLKKEKYYDSIHMSCFTRIVRFIETEHSMVVARAGGGEDLGNIVQWV